MNRRTPKEVIEKGNPKTEQAYIKFPREEPIKVSKFKGEKEKSVIRDMKLIKKLLKENKIHPNYKHIHTHPYVEGRNLTALPSGEDLKSFYNRPKEKMEIIAGRDVKTGEVLGYTILLKRKEELEGKSFFKTIKDFFSDELGEKVYDYNYELRKLGISPQEGYKKLNKICEEQGWMLRFVPSKGYYFDKETGNFEKNKSAGLERTIASIIGVSILLFALFNVVNINGFVVNNYTSLYSVNVIWISTIIICMVLFFVFRRKKRKLRK